VYDNPLRSWIVPAEVAIPSELHINIECGKCYHNLFSGTLKNSTNSTSPMSEAFSR
ncbi:10191_t:CDS:1, partial [Ambispora gerdemannii]